MEHRTRGKRGWRAASCAAVLLGLVLAPAPSYADPLPGQIIVDPDHPQWLKRQDGGPFFLCGAGDPEDFLYRGTRQSDGTRSGGDQATIIDRVKDGGTNGIYLMAVRSHGGDGGSNQNPWVNSDPTQGLDQDILDQWETWFDEMDQNGIVIYFFLYDDSSRPFAAGDAVPAGEQAFIAGLVSEFKHHKNLIWLVAEEYSESFSAQRVRNIAAEIRAADDHAHPIGSHGLSSLNFTAFANDPNIDQFAVQWTDSTAGFHDAMVSAWDDAAGRYNLTMAEGHPDAFGDLARLRSWAVAMGGAYIAHLRWFRPEDTGEVTDEDLAACGRVVQFFESTNFNEMAPHDELAHGGTNYVLAKPGDSYIAYASALVGSLGLKNMAAGLYDFTWFDTQNGATVEQTAIAVAAGDRSWSKPAGIGSELAAYIRLSDDVGAALPAPANLRRTDVLAP